MPRNARARPSFFLRERMGKTVQLSKRGLQVIERAREIGSGQFAGNRPEPSEPSKDGRRWYVARTWPGREYRVRDALREREAEVFLPLFREVRVYRHTRTTYRHVGPLFPLYVFVRFDPEEPWRWIRELAGVAGIIERADHSPAPVREGRVEELIALSERAPGGILRQRDLVAAPKPKWKNKQALLICDGSLLDGQVGRYVGEGDGFVTLELDILGRTMRWSVAEALVTAA